MNVPRKHHYCPEFYLNFFKGDNENFFTFDLRNGHVRSSRPRNEACQRDFYRVDIDEGDQFIIEKELSKLEQEFARVLKEVNEKLKIPTEASELGYLLSFVALMFERVPTRRNITNDFIDRLTRLSLRTAMSHKDTSQSFSDIDWELVEKSLDDDGISIVASRNTHVKNLISNSSFLVDLLAQRNWSLIKNETKKAFICSDNPANLSGGIKYNGSIYSPGFLDEATEVTIPISETLMLFGHYSDDFPDLMTLSRECDVASMNSKSANGTYRYIYSGQDDFIWLNRDNEVRLWRDHPLTSSD